MITDKAYSTVYQLLSESGSIGETKRNEFIGKLHFKCKKLNLKGLCKIKDIQFKVLVLGR